MFAHNRLVRLLGAFFLLSAFGVAEGPRQVAHAEGPNAIVTVASSVNTGGDACQDTFLNRNDDLSTGAVPIGFTANFFGVAYNNLYVNNNGNVTFDGPLGTYTPFNLLSTSTKIIAPFFGDVDTRAAGSDVVLYSIGTGTYEGRPTFCANWVNVGYYSFGTDKLNSFQLLLIDRSDVGVGDFDIVFNYDKIQWEAGSASGGSGGLGGASARVGYSNGTNTAFELPGSAVNGAFLDSNTTTGLIYNSLNSTQLGRYTFAARNGIVLQEICGNGLDDDNDGAVDEGCGTNQAPTPDAGADTGGDEGSTIALSGSALDPDAGDTVSTSWSYTAGAGVDAGATCTIADASAISTTISCTDDGQYTVTLTADDGVNPAVSDSANLAVGNALPAVTAAGPAASVSCGANNASLNVSFSDAGANDTHTASLEWGDGSTPDTVDPALTGFTAWHTYALAGVYNATATVTDDDGGSGADSSNSVTVDYTVVGGGILPPINQDGTSVFKQKSTIPVKIKLADCDGSYPSDLAPEISVEQISAAAPPVSINEPISTSAADTTGVMRFSLSDNQYIYNLAANQLADSAATYRVIVSVPETGQTATATFGIKP